MKKGKGKNKGNAFQWEIARELSLAWTNGESIDTFCPSQSSGARATTRAKKGQVVKYQGSDITFNDPIGEPLIRFANIECKTGYAKKRGNKKDEHGKAIKTQWDLLDLIDSTQDEPTILGFWRQCKEDSKKNNTEPILIFRRNYRKSCICIPFFLNGSRTITKLGSVIEGVISFEQQDSIFVNLDKDNVIVMEFNYFLRNFIISIRTFLEKCSRVEDSQHENKEEEKGEDIQSTCGTKTDGKISRNKRPKRKNISACKAKG